MSCASMHGMNACSTGEQQVPQPLHQHDEGNCTTDWAPPLLRRAPQMM